MSIIHDALKKVQHGLIMPKEPAGQVDGEPIEHLPSKKNKARSVLALLCAIALTVGSLVFCYTQLHPYVARTERSAKSSFLKLIQNKNMPFSKNFVPEKPLPVPLAKITVTPPKPTIKPTTNPTAAPDMANLNASVTLNVQGVMTAGSKNIALINDEVYQEGDDIDGVKIVKISLDAITVINNGREETIHVKK